MALLLLRQTWRLFRAFRLFHGAPTFTLAPALIKEMTAGRGEILFGWE